MKELLVLALATLLPRVGPQETGAVAQGVKDLANDNIAVRDRAAQELILLGDTALPALEASCAAATDDEIRGRLRGVIEAIRHLPFEAFKKHCRDALKGRYLLRGGEIERRPGEICSPAVKTVLPQLTVVEAWSSGRFPADRLLLAYDHRGKSVSVLNLDLIRRLAPKAESDERKRIVAAAVSSLLGTCEYCPVPEVDPKLFELHTDENGSEARGTFVHLWKTGKEHAVCVWKVAFDAGGALQTFSERKDYRSKHE